MREDLDFSLIDGEEIEIKYEDLDVDVENDWTEFIANYGTGPEFFEDNHHDEGTVDNWTYDYYVKPEDVVSFIMELTGKEELEITQQDVDSVSTEEDGNFYNWLKDKYEEAAKKDAEENYKDDDVKWIDPDDYWDEDEAMDRYYEGEN